jgi:hypothetical protein
VPLTRSTSRITGAEAPPRVRASRALVALLAAEAALGVFFLLRPALQPGPFYGPRPSNPTSFWWLVLLAFLPYAAALRAARRGALPGPRALLGGVALLLALLVPAPPQQSQDVFQYLLYGRMAADGVNPYVFSPSTFDHPWRSHARWADATSVYGPAWTLATEAVARLAGGGLVVALLLEKALVAALTLAAAACLAAAAGAGPGATRPPPLDPAGAVLAFAYNPLVLVAAGLGGHVDAALAACLAGALLASRRGRPLVATALLAVAALVKAYAALVLLAWLLVLARRRGGATAVGHAGVCAGLAVLGFARFWAGSGTLEALWRTGRQASASLTGGLARLLSGRWDVTAGATPAGTAIGLVALAVLGVAAWRLLGRARREAWQEEDAWRAGTALLVLNLFLTPWFLPWHLVAALALVAAVPAPVARPAVLVFSASAGVALPGGVQTAARYLPPLAAAWRARRRAAADRARRGCHGPR